MTLIEISDRVREAPRISIVGTGSKRSWAGFPSQPELSIRPYAGVIQHDVEDQVVVARAGTSIEELNAALAEHGQTLPILDPVPFGTLGGAIAMNLPHLAEGRCGSWRDWTLGLTVVRADGEIAKCGSKAVKNVAGYDVQKLFIGSRGRWGVIAEVVLRTYPLAAFRKLTSDVSVPTVNGPVAIQRVLRTDRTAAFAAAGDDLIVGDDATATLWRHPRPDLTRYAGDWIIRSDEPPQTREPYASLDRRFAAIIDPTAKFS